MGSRRQLTGLFYSPWTEKAKWALDYHHLPYHYHEHFMILDVPRLRLTLRKFRGGITVPALVDKTVQPAVRLMDSWEIASHADQIGKREKLLPENQVGEIRQFNERSESALSAGRVLLVQKMVEDRGARLEALPPMIPSSFRRPLRFLSGIGLAYLRREFEIGEGRVRENEKILREILLSLRAILSKGKVSYLLGSFSYADIAMAVILQLVDPVSNRYLPIGPALRRSFRQERLAGEFQDLLEWRDRLYRDHRRS